MIEMVLAFVLGPVLTNFSVANYGQPSAALWKDQLFVAVTSRELFPNPYEKFPLQPNQWGPGPGVPYRTLGFLYRGAFTPTARRVRDPIEHDNPCIHDYPSTQAKLHLRDDRVLLFQGHAPYVFPMAEVPLLERSELAFKLMELRGYRGYYAFIDGFRGQLMPVPEAEEKAAPRKLDEVGTFNIIGWEEYMRDARHDMQIAGPKSVRFFHAHKGKLFMSVEPDYLNNWYLDKKGNVAKDLPKPPDRQLRTGKLPADFTERFAAYTAGGRDYLVTINGKVYMAVAKGKAEVEVTGVWSDPRRKIVGVVQDQENDAVYGWGFATDSTSPERFYVKFDPKPVAVPYKLTVPLRGDRSDAYLESYECARACRNAMPKK
jgi:hypothetical protein